MWRELCVRVRGCSVLGGGLCRRSWVKAQLRASAGESPARGCAQAAGRSRSGPRYRLLFFGSDGFAVESLKRLHESREDGALVDLLEVVTLPKSIPVQKYAEQHELRVHNWPDVDFSGQFDVGVVVSFGCLIKEHVINRFPYGILNVHPSLLPRWRGPAPVFHTVMQGDPLTGVSIMQIRPKRFDVGPILSQGLHPVPEKITAEELEASLAVLGAELLIDTLKNLPERIANRKEQAKEGSTFAPKICSSMSWLVWEEQTCEEIDRLYRALGSRIPLRTMWMGRPVKLLDFVGRFQPCTGSHCGAVPGSVHYQKDLNTLLVCCKDGWVGFRTIKLRKNLSAADFYNGYIYHSVNSCQFQSYRERPTEHSTKPLLLKTGL